jgi:hypothetical protein
MAPILHGIRPLRGVPWNGRGRPHVARQEIWSMKNETGNWGLILGGLVALAAVLFIFSDGRLGGKTTVSGDQDLPPIATAEPK